MVKLNGQVFIKDRKTTKNDLSAKYFAQFSPNGQVSQYTLAGQIAFGEDVKGLIIEGIQIGTTFARFRRAAIGRRRRRLPPRRPRPGSRRSQVCRSAFLILPRNLVFDLADSWAYLPRTQAGTANSLLIM
jgi:hypothetical protein